MWFALRQHGVEAYKDMVREHLRLARYLAELVEQSDDFELVLEPALSVCCFRYVPADVTKGDPSTEGYLDTLNRELELALIDNGGASVSGTTIDGMRVLRACIVNHRVTTKGLEETFELLRKSVAGCIASPEKTDRARSRSRHARAISCSTCIARSMFVRQAGLGAILSAFALGRVRHASEESRRTSKNM